MHNKEQHTHSVPQKETSLRPHVSGVTCAHASWSTGHTCVCAGAMPAWSPHRTARICKAGYPSAPESDVAASRPWMRTTLSTARRWTVARSSAPPWCACLGFLCTSRVVLSGSETVQRPHTDEAMNWRGRGLGSGGFVGCVIYGLPFSPNRFLHWWHSNGRSFSCTVLYRQETTSQKRGLTNCTKPNERKQATRSTRRKEEDWPDMLDKVILLSEGSDAHLASKPTLFTLRRSRRMRVIQDELDIELAAFRRPIHDFSARADNSDTQRRQTRSMDGWAEGFKDGFCKGTTHMRRARTEWHNADRGSRVRQVESVRWWNLPKF